MSNQGQDIAADLACRRPQPSQDGFGVEVAEKLKGVLVVIIQTPVQFKTFTEQVAHAVHGGVGELTAQIVVVQFFQKTTLGVTPYTVHEVGTAFPDVFFNRPQKIFTLAVTGGRHLKSALQFGHNGVHVPLR